MGIFSCAGVGISGTTDIYTRQVEGGTWEARVGVALMGITHQPQEWLDRVSPFAENFNDNYAEGKGVTEEEAIAALKDDLKNLAESLWL